MVSKGCFSLLGTCLSKRTCLNKVLIKHKHAVAAIQRQRHSWPHCLIGCLEPKWYIICSTWQILTRLCLSIASVLWPKYVGLRLSKDLMNKTLTRTRMTTRCSTWRQESWNQRRQSKSCRELLKRMRMTESSGVRAFRKSDATLSISECVESCAATDGSDLLQFLAWHLIILALSFESISSSHS